MTFDFKVTIKELKTPHSLETPKFNICYSPGNNSSQPKRSYQIISALNGAADLVLEVNSSLFNIGANQRGDAALNFLEEIRALNWDFRYRKITAPSSGNSLEMLFSFMKKSDNTAHQIFVTVPAAVWRDESLILSLLPVHGVRYYIGATAEVDPLDALFNGQYTDEQVLSLFKLICYDCPGFGQMGVYTQDVTQEELRNMLG